MDSRGAQLDVFAWRPPGPLTVVIAEADVVELAEKLTRDGWWRLDNRLSVNGIRIDAHAEQFWNPDPCGPRPRPDQGEAWMSLVFPGYSLACYVRRDTARDVAAGLTGQSSVIVPVHFNCEPDDDPAPADPVAVYFKAERSQPPPSS